MDLSILGWSSFCDSREIDSTTIARILAVHRSHLSAATKDKEINLHLSGQLIDPPAVGDWVEITPEFEDEQGKPAAIISRIIERKTKLSRWNTGGEQVIAANIDTVFVVTSANQDFNINRLQRYLLLIRDGGAQPVIVLSKIDLSNDAEKLLAELSEKFQVPCLGTSLVNNIGVEDVKELMPVGSTSIFVGSSGVGKSSLVNFLLGEEVQVIQDIRVDDAKGKHTTTSRQMFRVPKHGLIIDTPGIRAVQVFGDQESVDETFPKVTELLSGCRFSDCLHQDEPGCAIVKALASGDLESKEWENYQKLQKEVAYAKRKTDKAEMANSKKRWKEINVNYKKRKKFEDQF